MAEPADITSRLESVREQVEAATAAAGRRPGSVAVVAVSKRVGPEEIARAYAAGQRDFGENYLQAAEEKMQALEGRGLSEGIRWHMVGQLQSNKARRAALCFDLIQSLSSLSTGRVISKAMVSQNRAARVLIQIKLGGGPGRGGVEPEGASELAAELSALGGLVLDGVMGVAPLGEDPRPHFARLRRTLEALKALNLDHAPLGEMSAGMTEDFHDAVAEGATMVRLGSAVFGV